VEILGRTEEGVAVPLGETEAGTGVGAADVCFGRRRLMPRVGTMCLNNADAVGVIRCFERRLGTCWFVEPNP
jgi:hypothetical protein